MTDLRLQFQVKAWHLAAAVAATRRCIASLGLALCWLKPVRCFLGCSASGNRLLSFPNYSPQTMKREGNSRFDRAQ